MLLIIESGSTKSDWVLINNDQRTYFSTIGLNPYFHDEDAVEAAINANHELAKLGDKINTVHFYGAGCSADHLNAIIKRGIQRVFKHAKIVIDHDLTACAYATYTGEPAISCIIGTGSNSCFFDGQSLSEKVPALGYILGDEGSGTYMGKKLLADYLYKRLPESMNSALRNETGLTKDGIIEHVYKQPNANVYLASFVPFIYKFKEEDYVKQLVVEGFKQFLSIHVCSFDNYKEVPVHFVGSISRLFQKELEEACLFYNVRIGNVVQKPVDGLVNYHLKYVKTELGTKL